MLTAMRYTMDAAGVFRHYTDSGLCAMAMCILVDGSTLIVSGLRRYIEFLKVMRKNAVAYFFFYGTLCRPIFPLAIRFTFEVLRNFAFYGRTVFEIEFDFAFDFAFEFVKVKYTYRIPLFSYS